MESSNKRDADNNLDDLLNCSICLEVYKRPKYLPCLHTFCETCLTSYVTSFVKEEEATAGFKCPICRLDVEPPSNCDDITKWSELLPVNHLITSLLEQCKLQRQNTECQPCTTRNTKTNAESWCVECSVPICKSCADYHASIPILQTHSITPLDHVCTQPVLTTIDFCKVHTGEKLKMFCRDHDAPCCATCTIVDHRKCDNVITIQDAAKEFKIDRNADLTSTLTQRMDDLDALLLKKKEILTDIEKNLAKIRGEIKDFRASIEQNLDKAQANLFLELDKVNSKNKQVIMDDVETILNKRKVLENGLKILKISYKKSSEVQYYLESKKLSILGTQVGDFLKEKQEEGEERKCRLDLNEHLRNITHLGYLLYKDKNLDCTEPVLQQQDTYTLGPTFKVGKPNDSNTSAVCIHESGIGRHHEWRHTNACAWLPWIQRILVLTDVSLYTFTAEGTLDITINFKINPWDVAFVNDEFFAITFPHSSLVILYTFDEEKNLSVQWAMETPTKCYGVSTFDGKIYVTCGKEVIGYETSGNSIHRLNIGNNALYLGITDNGTIYSADGSHVYKHDMNGCKLDSFYHGRPRISVDKQGTLFMYSPSSSTVHVRSPDGSAHKTYIENIRLVPKAMCFLGDDTGTFCIISGSANLDYTLNIFQLVHISLSKNITGAGVD